LRYVIKQHGDEYKKKIAQKMLSPDGYSIEGLMAETGVARSTLYSWRNRYGFPQSNSKQWDSHDIFSILIETATMNKKEVVAYCCKYKISPQQISSWKSAAILGLEFQYEGEVLGKEKVQEIKCENTNLREEIKRKDKALAEVAARLILPNEIENIGCMFVEKDLNLRQ